MKLTHEISLKPNPPLNSDPVCIDIRSLTASPFLASAHRLGTGESA